MRCHLLLEEFIREVSMKVRVFSAHENRARNAKYDNVWIGNQYRRQEDSSTAGGTSLGNARHGNVVDHGGRVAPRRVDERPAK